MNNKAKIIVNGAWAELKGPDTSVHLESSLALLDPKAFFNQAYKEGRWDGMVRLYRNTSFPAGLVEHVCAYFADTGSEVTVTGAMKLPPIDLSRFSRDYLPGITLWEHQYDAAVMMMTKLCGWCCRSAAYAS